MPSYIDLTGQRFGRLLVKTRSGTHKLGGAIFECTCDCGNVVQVRAQSLRQCHTKSCGCLNSDQKRDICIERNTSHGQTGTKTYETWVNMLSRCFNKNSLSYKKYGARGTTVCKRWLKFENFFSDMGKRPIGYTLDRINTRGNYEPTNCRWATMKQQQNNRNNNVRLTLNGDTFTIQEWARRTGISRETISKRIRAGWDTKRALSEKPILGRNQYS